VRIATWNVNSIRARVDRVIGFLERQQVDVLAMQETKCRDDQFPHLLFEAAGYQVAHLGHSQWNGVAIASRVGLEDVQVGFEGMPQWGDPPAAEARAISALCAGVRIWSLYVPNGRTLEDPHLLYKLDWLRRLAAAAHGWLEADPDAQIGLLGDWNIAPTDEDVWSVEFYAGRTHTSPAEGPGVYTYWDYTQLRFPKNRGMRIDFALGSPALQARVDNAFFDREERKGKGASDHAPVVVDLR
jgi:exodeoxyribonuclease-3